MSIPKLSGDVCKVVAKFVDTPHRLMQTSKCWRAGVAAFLFQGYSQQELLKIYVMQAKSLHPNDHAEVDRARAVARRVLQDATGEPDGREGIFRSDILYPTKLSAFAENVSCDLLTLAYAATFKMQDEARTSLSNILTPPTDRIVEKADTVRRWMHKNQHHLKLGKLDVVGSYTLRYIVPPEIQLFSVTKLSLFNHLVTFLPAAIGHLTELETLYAPQNNLVRIPSEIGKLSKLKSLTLSQNRLLSLPVELAHLTNLSALNLESNCFNSIPRELLTASNPVIAKALATLPEDAFAPIPPPPAPSMCERLSAALWNCCSYVLETLAGWLTALARWIRP